MRTLKPTYMLAIMLLMILPMSGQNPNDTVALKQQLEVIRTQDQITRTSSSVEQMHYYDSLNLVQVERIIATYGWPGKSLVGSRGNNTVFLVVQHADLATQEKYFPLLAHSASIGESDSSDMALMEDRILMRKGKPQRYGSQIVNDPDTGGWKFWPIDDEIHVNARRSAAGLIPIEEYAAYFGIKYIAPNE